MAKNQNFLTQEFRTRPVAYGIQIVGIVVILLNLWLSTKLFPLAKDLDSLAQKVKAAESSIVSLQEVSKSNQEIVVKLETISVSLGEVKARIERIDTRLAKHMGI